MTAESDAHNCDRSAVARLRIERTGQATIQDLGRPGYAGIGISVNGALDQHAARTANILVGNADTSPVIESTGSDLTFVPDSDVLMSVTGAAEEVQIDGYAQPAWETLAVSAGSRVTVPAGRAGVRAYLAVNGELQGPRALGSVAPDGLLGVGHRLEAGATITVHTAYDGHPPGLHEPLFRLGARPPRPTSPTVIDATDGPDLGRLALGRDALSSAPLEVLPQSDHVGLRLRGPSMDQTSTDEILSRGVPVGAVEVVPSGEVIILLRGRLVTAGYPVVAVVTTGSLDRLGQVRPGDLLRIEFCDIPTARARLVARDDERKALATRVQTAFEAGGLGHLIDPAHASRGSALRHT